MRHLNANMCKEIECYMFNDRHSVSQPASQSVKQTNLQTSRLTDGRMHAPAPALAQHHQMMVEFVIHS